MTIKMVAECYRNEVKSFKSIQNTKNIYRVNFDRFAENTDYILKEICNFLNLKKTKFTKQIMNRERVPRKINPYDRQIKENKIKKLVRKEIFEELKRLEDFHFKNEKN